MGFTLIKGQFMPKAGTPDGDSVRFKPNNLNLLKKLEGVKAEIGTGVTTKDTVQLRFEGIDAIEKGATKPLSVEAKDNMMKLIGTSIETPEPRGYILARMTDPHGRVVAFAFSGTTSSVDGSEVFLDDTLLGKSVNYKQLLAGYAYPLYYNTLFASLRNKFNKALKQAKRRNRGYWVLDKTLLGVTVNGQNSLASIDPIWPKLWRRFEEYLRSNANMSNFISWLDDKNERVVLIDSADETGLANVVNVQGNTVSLTQKPENLMIITAIERG